MLAKHAGNERDKNVGDKGSGFKKDFKGNQNRRKDFRSNNSQEGKERREGSQGRYQGNKDAKPGSKSNGNFRGGNQRDNKGYKKDFGAYDKDKKDRDGYDNRSMNSGKEKTKEHQPDKMEIINRIEKEKKAMQKKQAENKRKNAKPLKTVVKPPKRCNNIDWTKEYENDSFDDDDLDIYL